MYFSLLFCCLYFSSPWPTSCSFDRLVEKLELSFIPGAKSQEASVDNIQNWILYSPSQRIDIKRLTILSMAPVGDANFYVVDMEAISEHPDVDTLLLKVVTCPLGHLPSDATYDIFPGLTGFQHLAVVPAKDDLEVILDAKAALPCPPHCSGSKLWLTLADFLESH